MSTTPCELHELINCSTCTGRDAAFNQSLHDPVFDRGAVPYIPGGVTIHARYAGRCAGCGEPFAANDAIHRPRDGDGWLRVECCA